MSAAKRVIPLHALGRPRVRPGDLRSAARAAANILEGMCFVDEHDAEYAREVLEALRSCLAKGAK